MPDSSPHIEPEFVMPSHETLRAWCVRARSGEGSPYVHISPDELEGLLEQLQSAQRVADTAEYHQRLHAQTMEQNRDLHEQLETAEARANAAEAFIVRMDMAYRYEEFRLADPNPACAAQDPASIPPVIEGPMPGHHIPIQPEEWEGRNPAKSPPNLSDELGGF